MKQSNYLDTYNLGRMVNPVWFYLFDPKTNAVKKTVDCRNQVLYSGADVLAQLLSGKQGYHVSAMYLEYKNLADPEDPITPPAFDRSGGIAYYNGLSSLPDVDFIRAPLVSNPAILSSGVEYQGNQLTFFAQSEGTVGFHGKPFSEGANSAVYGAALVVTPDYADQGQDIVFARVYAGVDKILKETGHEVGITWVVRFG